MSARTGTLFWLPHYLADERLDAIETLLLVKLADHVDIEDRCWPSMESLAAAARCSYSTARRRLARLEERGWLSRRRRRAPSGNLSTYEYTLLRGPYEQGQPEPPEAPPDPTEPAQTEPPSLSVSASKRSPGRALASAHQGERAELPSENPPVLKNPAPDGAEGALPLPGCEPPSEHAQARERAKAAEKLLRAEWEARDPRPTQNFIGVRKVIERLLAAGWEEPQLAAALSDAPVWTAASLELALRRSRSTANSGIMTDRSEAEGLWHPND